MTSKEAEKIIKDKTRKWVKIDLGCGDWRQDDFIGVDMYPGKAVDIIQNLEDEEWIIPANCADLVVASHLVEHINPANFGFIKFMNNVWRILKPGGQFMISCPYAGSPGYWQDPTHINPCTERTWLYFDPLSRVDNGTLYQVYRPKPWKLIANNYVEYGNCEVALEKRKEDPSYGNKKTGREKTNKQTDSK